MQHLVELLDKCRAVANIDELNQLMQELQARYPVHATSIKRYIQLLRAYILLGNRADDDPLRDELQSIRHAYTRIYNSLAEKNVAVLPFTGSAVQYPEVIDTENETIEEITTHTESNTVKKIRGETNVHPAFI